jgi:hypothetical protein
MVWLMANLAHELNLYAPIVNEELLYLFDLNPIDCALGACLGISKLTILHLSKKEVGLIYKT